MEGVRFAPDRQINLALCVCVFTLDGRREGGMYICIGMGGMKVCVIVKLSVSESKQEFYIF